MRDTMTGGSSGLRMSSNGSMLQNNNNNSSRSKNNINNRNGVTGLFVSSSGKTFVRKSSSMMLMTGSNQREKFLLVCCKYLGRRRVAMLMLGAIALSVFVLGSLLVHKESASRHVNHHISTYGHQVITDFAPKNTVGTEDALNFKNSSTENVNSTGNPPFPPLPSLLDKAHPLSSHPCENFAFPPPPPPGSQRPGPRPCPVCYLPVEQAIASMPSSPSASPVLQKLSYVQNQNPVKTEQHGGSDFVGYPSLQQRNDSFDIKDSMTVHCGFVKGSRPGHQTGFDINEADLVELEKFHEVIVASAIFGNYDVVQHPQNISDISRKNVPFFMFVDEETEAFMKNSSMLDNNKRVGLWRIIVVHNIPYTDGRRNGKVPKLLLQRLFPNVRYSIWIDGKLQLVVDPYQVLERFLWRQNATFAISRHYRRFDVFVEAAANKAAGKYDNASIDSQIDFYKQEGLTPYSEAKLPITSDVPEGCVILREHIPITNLFTCLWFNEVDRFTARDQLSFSTVRDKIRAKVNWNLNMFLDCERRNFVIQSYHRDLLEQMPPPAAGTGHNLALPGRKTPRKKRGKKSGSKRHRKAAAGTIDNNNNTSLLL